MQKVILVFGRMVNISAAHDQNGPVNDRKQWKQHREHGPGNPVDFLPRDFDFPFVLERVNT